jgi:DNA polymerase-3 subunit delta'
MSFSDLKGQKAAAELLQRSLQHGRLAHAYLITGPRGSGKEALARTLAKALNCLKKQHDSCDHCDSCKRIDECLHPDIYWVRPQSKGRRISVDQIREFERSIHLRPTEARVKLGVIVDADCMGEEASNAFLKTLEEPPVNTIIVLLSAEPQRLLPTILSRCLKLSLGAAATRTGTPYRSQVLPLLAGFSAQDKRGIPDVYRLLGELTGLLQAIRAETRQRVEGEENLERYEQLEPKMRERMENQLEARIEGEYRAAREQVLEEMYAWFGDLLLCVEGAGEELFDHAGSVPALRRAATGLTSAQASANLDAVEQIREALARNITETLALEVGLLKLAGALRS